MKRSPLKRTPFVRKKADVQKKHAEGKRRDSTRRAGRLRKVGKTGRKNRKALTVFKRDTAKLGIDRCERRGKNCTGTEDLTWAHGRKRRELREGELEKFAIVCCVNCHREMDEQMTHDEMAAEVTRIIGLRPERYLEAA